MGSEDMVMGSIDQAWREFRSALADRIFARDEDDHILWELDVPERDEIPCGPFVQVRWMSEYGVLAEVSSNRVLAKKFRLDKDLRRTLLAAGWNRPDKDHLNYWVGVDPGSPDRPAAMLTAALRDVFGVVHPAFLVDPCAAELKSIVEGDEAIEQTSLLAVAEPVEGPDELNSMIDIALGSDMGQMTPTRDDDGDIPYLAGSAVVFVHVPRDRPVIRIFCELVVDVTDQTAAAFEVAVLNRDHGAVKFRVYQDRVIMFVEIQAQPFVPEHLRSALAGMCELAPTLDSDLAHRVGGRKFCEASGEAE